MGAPGHPGWQSFQRPEDQLAEWAFNEWVLKIFISQSPDGAKKKTAKGSVKRPNESNLICWKVGFTSRILAGRETANYCSNPSRSYRSVGPQSRWVRETTTVSVQQRWEQSLF